MPLIIYQVETSPAEEDGGEAGEKEEVHVSLDALEASGRRQFDDEHHGGRGFDSNQADDKEGRKLPPAEAESAGGRPSHHRLPPSASAVLTALPQSRTYDRNASASALPSSNTTAAPSRLLLMLPPPLLRPVVATPGAPSRHGDADAVPNADGNAISNNHDRAGAMTAQRFAPPLRSGAALPASASADDDGVACQQIAAYSSCLHGGVLSSAAIALAVPQYDSRWNLPE